MRTKVFARYKKNLPTIEFVEARPNTQSSHHKLVMLSESRDELAKFLEKNGIETKIHYKNTLDGDNRHRVAEGICANAISLPIYPHLKMEEVDYVCERIKKFNGIR